MGRERYRKRMIYRNGMRIHDVVSVRRLSALSRRSLGSVCKGVDRPTGPWSTAQRYVSRNDDTVSVSGRYRWSG